jgi:hypothetical protein
VKLIVGDRRESVTVNADAIEVNAVDATVSRVVDHQVVENILRGFDRAGPVRSARCEVADDGLLAAGTFVGAYAKKVAMIAIPTLCASSILMCALLMFGGTNYARGVAGMW